MGGRVPVKPMLVVFCPFAAFQLPLGVLLDRYGPRRTVAAPMCSAAALLIFLVVPEKKLPGEGQTLHAQIAAFREIFVSAAFWRIALPLVLGQATYIALQGLWLGPWLYDVAGLERPAVANYLLVTAVAYMLGSVFFGVSSDRLARAGVSRVAVYKIAMVTSLAMLALLAAGIKAGLGAILAVYAFTGISSALAYALMTQLFPPEMTGRVSTASNMMMFACSFGFQWGVGALLELYPVVDGRYAPAGYSAAFAILALLQLAAVLGLLTLRQPRL